jgi:two-component system sensor histidine kinase RpfC
MIIVDVSQLRAFLKRIFLFKGGLLGLEQGQAVMRFAITVPAFIYVYTVYFRHIWPAPLPPALIALIGYFLFTIGNMVVCFRATKHSPTRRVIATIADVSIVSTCMIALGRFGVPLTVLYLWLIIGNGLRYGVKSMMMSVALSMAGFAVTTSQTQIWQQEPIFVYAVFLMLILLPFYIAILVRELHKARLSAETANRAKSGFFARVSHDLRTPMNGIMATADILQKSRGLSAEHRELLNLIQDSAHVSLRQIDNVLDFAKLEAGRLSLDPHPFELRQLIAASVRMVANTAREKKLRLLETIAPETPNNLVGDLHHLRMVLMNLLANAIKFTSSGYVAIKIESVGATPETVTLRFCVHDTGIGIAPEALVHIWENFRQEHEQIARRYGGTGLGTTIAKQLVELMGGRIAAASTKGQGSQFWFEVPLARHTSEAGADVAHPVYRVLLLSEDPGLVDALRAALAPSEAMLFAVESAEDAYAAFARAARFGRSWNLVLVDDALIRRHGGQRCEALFMQSGGALETPMYLLTQSPCPDHELWARGYSGALPRGGTLPALAQLASAASPLDADPDADPRVVRVAPWIWRGVRKSVPRVLIADDNYTNRKVITMVLESAGFAVDAVADGESALQKLVVGDYKAVVLDLHMPEMNGADVVRQYTALSPGKTRPILMLSSDTTEAARTEAQQAGASVYLTKPIGSDVLIATLERLIEEHDVVPLTLEGEARARRLSDAPKVLDMEVLMDLERICKNTKAFSDVIKSFETEADTLSVRIDKAASGEQHATLAELTQAMKGLAANVGAVQMVQVCDRILTLSPQEAEAVNAAALTGELRAIYAVSRNALYELVYPSASSNG